MNEEIQTPQAEEMDAKPLTFDELLSVKEYQSEFDKRVSKALETSKSKWQIEEETKRTEAEKLARMDEKEKSDYELKKAIERAELAESKYNASELRKTAYEIASEKNVPVSYLNLVDFSKETAESINQKIQEIADTRTKDLESYLNSKLKETAPKQVAGATSKDPFLQGFEDGWKK